MIFCLIYLYWRLENGYWSYLVLDQRLLLLFYVLALGWTLFQWIHMFFEWQKGLGFYLKTVRLSKHMIFCSNKFLQVWHFVFMLH